MSNKKYKVHACLICDIVRKEQGGKDVLIGVYGGSIVTDMIPLVMPNFAIWLQVHADRMDYKDMEFEVVGPDGEALAGGKGKVSFNNTDHPAGIPLQFHMIAFPLAGYYTIKFGLDRKPVPIGKFEVIKRVA